MSWMVSVDPGLNHCGYAIWCDRSLLQAGLARNTGEGKLELGVVGAVYSIVKRFVPSVPELVIELPKVYQGNKQKGDPNDLINLAAVVGAISVAYDWRGVKWVYPHQWKGQTPKPVMEARIKQRLSPTERGRVIEAGALTHNIWDAVGIGLDHLDRLRKGATVSNLGLTGKQLGGTVKPKGETP